MKVHGSVRTKLKCPKCKEQLAVTKMTASLYCRNCRETIAVSKAKGNKALRKKFVEDVEEWSENYVRGRTVTVYKDKETGKIKNIQ